MIFSFKNDQDDYLYNEHITEKMSLPECINYLSTEADKMLERNEVEIAYEIYREILRRKPEALKNVYEKLTFCITKLGKIEELEAIKKFIKQ